MAPEPLLTFEERALVNKLGTCWNDYAALRDHMGDTDDVQEFVGAIHRLQEKVMARAAIRAYPTRYRGLVRKEPK